MYASRARSKGWVDPPAARAAADTTSVSAGARSATSAIAVATASCERWGGHGAAPADMAGRWVLVRGETDHRTPPWIHHGRWPAEAPHHAVDREASNRPDQNATLFGQSNTARRAPEAVLIGGPPPVSQLHSQGAVLAWLRAKFRVLCANAPCYGCSCVCHLI